MSRKTDLERSIRESCELVREYQEIIRLSSDPREKKRDRRAVAEQWELIGSYLDEYEPLCAKMGYEMPADIAEITAGVKRVDKQQTTEEPSPPSQTSAPPAPGPSINKDFCYGAFISYSRTDQPWVRRELLPRLEKVGISYIDQLRFEPGFPKLDEIERAVRESRRTLLILTPSYLKDTWRQFDSILVGSYGLDTNEWCAIPVIVQQCELPTRLRALVSVDLCTDEESEWQRLIGALAPPQDEKAGKLTIETVLIPEGEFWMGSTDDDDKAFDDEKPQHREFLPAYRIGKYPITNVQYFAFVRATHYAAPAHWPDGTIPPGKEVHPVVNVSYEDAMNFCRWLSDVKERRYRLPVEEEWEKSARGLDKRRYPWGDEWIQRCCNTAEAGIAGTTPVAEYEGENVSSFGVVDLSGNVAEWTCSWYMPYADSPSDSPHFGRKHRVVRGGGWINDAQWARVSFRGHYETGTRRSYLGFRVVLVEP